MGNVDLDRLANAYTHRPPSRATLDRADRAGLLLSPGSRILDVGGGPGDHSHVWHGSGHHPILLDPSAEMLSRARAKGVVCVRGKAQTLPFRPDSFDLVWFHLSIHYGDWRRTIDEALRVLGTGGTLEVWTLGPDHFEQSGLARWFPSIPAIDAARFPDPDLLAAYIAERGSTPSVTHLVEQVTTKAGVWIPAIEAGFVSTLQLLPDDERERGIAALKNRYRDPSEDVRYDLRFTRIVASFT